MQSAMKFMPIAKDWVLPRKRLENGKKFSETLSFPALIFIQNCAVGEGAVERYNPAEKSAGCFFCYNDYMTETIIFTDGAARGNPGPGGFGAILVTEDTVTELGGREDHTTNNRMELLAAISGIEKAGFTDPIIIYTDSAYVLSGATRWVFGWQKNNWKTSQKADVLNRDLWERLLLATRARKIDWRLLKGHSGISANERCDVIATSFADNKPIVLYFGARERYGVSLSVPNQNKISEKKPSRVYAHSYVSCVGGLITVHKTWEDCRAHVIGVSGAKYKKAKSPEEEAEIIKEFSEK